MSTRPSIPAQGIAISAVALGAAIALIVPMSASAATPVSQAEGRLLVATIGGAPSTPVAALNGASAIDATGTGGPVVADTPLDATALNGIIGITIPVGITTPDLFGSAGIIKLGAVGQYAQANDDGSSVAFSGTVAQATNPVLGIGTPTVTPFDAGSTAGDVEIGLGAAGDPVSVNATLGALAASAQQPVTGAPTGHYLLGDGAVVVGGTLTSTVVTPVDVLVAPVFSILGITDPLAGGQVTVSTDELLQAAAFPPGTTLNDLPAGTDLVQYLPQAVVNKVTGIVTELNTAIAAAPGPVAVLAQTLLTPVLGTVNGLLATVSASLLTQLATPLSTLLQLTVNNQSTTGGVFTQNALTVGVGPNGSIASVALANASVGPNAPLVTPPGTTPTGTTAAALLAETGVTVPVGATLAGAGLLAAAGFGLTRLAAWRRRGTHRGITSAR